MNVAPDGRSTGEGSHSARAGTLTLLSVAASADGGEALKALEETFSAMPLPSFDLIDDEPDAADRIREELEELTGDVPPILANSPAYIRANAELPGKGRKAEHRFIASTLERWLGERPQGELTLDREGGAAVAAMVGGWSATITHALAREPLSLAELRAGVQGLSRDAIAEYLGVALQTGQLEELSEGGRARYGLTDWGRGCIGPIVAAVRCERRHPDKEILPPDVPDVEAAFQLVLPLLHLPRHIDGSCRLGVQIPEAEPPLAAGATAEIAAGRVVSSSPLLAQDARNWVSGSPLDWIESVVEPNKEQVTAGGDLRIARGLLGAIHETLFGAPLG
jgi:DNA-binding HxlR family transcriptional regulator